MHHLIELIITFFTVWPGSTGTGSTDKRTFALGCLLRVLILVGLAVAVYFIVT